MKVIKNILFAGGLCVLFSCGGKKQQQVDLFPLVGYVPYDRDKHYYVDENGGTDIRFFGKIDELGGKNVRKISYFSCGLGKLTTVDGNNYFINKQGEIVLNIAKLFGEHYKCSDFSEGIAFVKAPDSEVTLAIDTQGKILFELEGKPITPFEDGLALFESTHNYGNYGIINNKGKIVLEPQNNIYKHLPPKRGMLCVQDGQRSRYGVMNLKGEIIIDYISNTIISFDDNDCARVLEDMKWGLINAKGEYLIEPQYYSLQNDGEWYQFATEENYDKVGWCDKNGKVKIEPIFDMDGSQLFYGDKWALVRLDGEQVFIDKKGRIVLEPEYEVVSPFMKDKAIVRINEKRRYHHAFMNREGELITDEAFVVNPVYKEKIGSMLVGNQMASWDRGF